MGWVGMAICLFGLAGPDGGPPDRSPNPATLPDDQSGRPQSGAPPAPGAGDDRTKAAERLFEEGQRHYERGDYGSAIARFAEAYELFPAPILIFDIAQAHRRQGDCPKALQEYRRFRELAPTLPEAALTEEHIRTLERACNELPGSGVTGAPISPVVPTPSPPPASPDLRPRPPLVKSQLQPSRNLSTDPKPIIWSGSLRAPWLRFLVLVAGLGAGLAATAIELDSRRSLATWRAEDRRLAMPGLTQDRASLDDWVGRQQRNDRLADSLRRRHAAAIGLGVTSLIGLVGGTILSFPYTYER